MQGERVTGANDWIEQCLSQAQEKAVEGERPFPPVMQTSTPSTNDDLPEPFVPNTTAEQPSKTSSALTAAPLNQTSSTFARRIWRTVGCSEFDYGLLEVVVFEDLLKARAQQRAENLNDFFRQSVTISR